LAFWSVLVVVIDIFPVTGKNWQLTLDMPVLLAVALLYQPEVASTVALIAALDLRELKRDVPLSRAIFNRCQVAGSILVAGVVFHTVADGLVPWPVAILGTAAALTADFLCNATLVSAYMRFRDGLSFSSAIRSLRVGDAGQFLITYLGYGLLALVMARLFNDVGPWSVVGLLLPTLVARQMLLRGERIQRMADTLRDREGLLHEVLDRLVEERRDERLRVAAELHDEVLQNLIAIRMQGRRVEKGISLAGLPTGDAEELVSDAETSIMSLRRVIHDLHHSSIGVAGLVPTLKSLARDMQFESRVSVVVKATEKLDVDRRLEPVVYQVAREAILNALKHAGASRIDVSLHNAEGGLTLVVQDDGRGFDLNSVDRSTHFGLGLMQERLRKAGGQLDLSTGEAGTRVVACFPSREGRLIRR
jgi:signal transduction histidine kinase